MQRWNLWITVLVGVVTAVMPCPGVPASRVAGVLRGRILDDRTGSGCSGAVVCLFRLDSEALVPVSSGHVDGTGAFEFKETARGAYVVMATTDGRGPAAAAASLNVVVEADRTTEATLRLVTSTEPQTVLSGTIVQEDGSPPPGKLQFFVNLEGAGGAFLVLGEKGAFRWQLPAASRYWISDLWADGEAHPYVDGPVALTPGRSICLRLQTPRRCALRVLDLASGSPVAEARCYRFSRRDVEFRLRPPLVLLPGRNTLLRAPLSSDREGMIDLGLGRGTERLFVVGRGYSWCAVEVDRARDAAPVVRLRPGGALHVSVEHWSELDDATLYLALLAEEETRDSNPWIGRASSTTGIPQRVEAVGTSGEVEIEGLTPGRYLLVVRRGDWPTGGIIYGVEAAGVGATDPAEVRVPTNPALLRPRAVLRADIEVAEGWGEMPTVLRIKGLDPAIATAQYEIPLQHLPGRRTARGETAPIPEGSYEAWFDGLPWIGQVKHTRKDGPVSLRVPAPGMIRLNVVDSATGMRLRTGEVHWGPGGGLDSRWLPAGTLGDEGPLEVRCLPGPVRFRVDSFGWKVGEQETIADSSLVRSFRIGLVRAAILIVHVLTEGGPVGAGEARVTASIPLDCRDEAVKVVLGPSGDGRLVASSSASVGPGGRAAFGSLDPVTYQVDVEAPEGFDRPESVRARLERGKTTEIQVLLKRHR